MAGMVSRRHIVASTATLIAATTAPRWVVAGRAALEETDFAWLGRASYVPTAMTAAEYGRLGRRTFLRRQLDDAGTLPPAVQSLIDAMEISRRDGTELLHEAAAEQKRINSLPGGEQQQATRKAYNEWASARLNEAVERELFRAVYSPAQLREQLVWFWTNHFSIHHAKANGRILAADYVEQAIRPHVLGRFRDLVLATLTHPAMLQYLDNAQSAAGRINENYARELLELHTLGASSGYTQQDVQELARILTGAGVSVMPGRPRLKPEWDALYVRRGAFEFNPARHDFAAKMLLGEHFDGAGFEEVERAVDLIVAQPACAQFVSSRLATYFVADDPSAALVARMAKTFRRTGGDLRAVTETLFSSRELIESAGSKFRDPMQFVVATLRLAYQERTLVNLRPAVNWLNALGEPPFGRGTPDGYPLVASAWSSPGQIARRFEIARAIGSGGAGLFQPAGGTAATAQPAGFPQLATRFFYDVIEPRLGAQTRAALDRAASQAEWNTYLLASPELNYR